ncbi:MAG: Uncharacterised protein [Prochlorococcus marinus str. MIT 9215]|nr:MAG: Uncharacterised protein [Prochlorococcus marinus str. MIT 9215]
MARYQEAYSQSVVCAQSQKPSSSLLYPLLVPTTASNPVHWRSSESQGEPLVLPRGDQNELLDLPTLEVVVLLRLARVHEALAMSLTALR